MTKRINVLIEAWADSIHNINIQQSGVLITEEDVSDLKYADVSRRVYGKIKRVLDIVLSVVGMVVVLIPVLMIVPLVYIDDPGDILFTQYRVGQRGKLFLLYKFRTMKMDTPQYIATMDLERPDRYITRVGRFLRKTSLDEIPQLWNVLCGDMSLVGPRPLIANEREIHLMRSRFGVYQVRPGITGLAQINGRDQVSPNEKVHWDVKYLENFGLRQDIQILLETFPDALRGKGVAEGCRNSQWARRQ